MLDELIGLVKKIMFVEFGSKRARSPHFTLLSRTNTFSEATLFNWPDDGRSISRNVASVNMFFHSMINLLYLTTVMTVLKVCLRKLRKFIKPSGRQIRPHVCSVQIYLIILIKKEVIRDRSNLPLPKKLL